MLTKWITTYIEMNTKENEILLNEVQKDFVEKHRLLPENVKINGAIPFQPEDSLASKETDEEHHSLESIGELPISFVKSHPDEYIYAEEPIFATIGVDGISLEVDDVFGTITALFGLRVQKKHGDWLKRYIDEKLGTAPGTRSLMFSSEDGLWDVNLSLDYADGFDENYTVDEMLQFLYSWIFTMLAALEDEA